MQLEGYLSKKIKDLRIYVTEMLAHSRMFL